MPVTINDVPFAARELPVTQTLRTDAAPHNGHGQHRDDKYGGAHDNDNGDAAAVDTTTASHGCNGGDKHRNAHEGNGHRGHVDKHDYYYNDDDDDDDSEAYHILDAQGAVAYAARTLSRWRAFDDGTRLAPDTIVRADEVGDGNLNLVFLLRDAAGRSRAVLKQALPYVRMVGESWPLTTDRNRLEATTLQAHYAHCPATTERVLYTSVRMSATVVEDLSTCVVWRRALVQCRYHAHVAATLGRHLARVHFYTSDLAQDSTAKKRAVQRVTNVALCKITEDLFFTDPYTQHERNDYEAAQEALVQRLLRDDVALRRCVAALKWRFMTHAEAHLHGDIHSGSVFVDAHRVKVIDAEFGFYGPLGFDLGNVLGSLLLNYVALPGLLAQQQQQQQQQDQDERQLPQQEKENVAEGNDVNRAECNDSVPSSAAPDKTNTTHNDAAHDDNDDDSSSTVSTTTPALLLDGVVQVWQAYEATFRDLAATQIRDVAFASLPSYIDALLDEVWADAVGYTGAELVRRTIGLAHVADLDSIAHDATRLACKEAAVRLGRHLILHATELASVDALVQCVRDGDYLSE